MTTAELYTSGDIARMLGEKVQTVQYVLKTREHIRERARVAHFRLYDEDAVEAVRREVARMQPWRRRPRVLDASGQRIESVRHE